MSDPTPQTTPTRDEAREEELRIHALGAAISRREWWEVERAHAAIRDEFHARQRSLAPATAQSNAVATGWKLVPVEPTQTMNNAGSYCQLSENGLADEIYAAMLASAPAPASGVDAVAVKARLNEKAIEAACEAVLAVPDHPGDKQKIRDAIATYIRADLKERRR